MHYHFHTEEDQAKIMQFVELQHHRHRDSRHKLEAGINARPQRDNRRKIAQPRCKKNTRTLIRVRVSDIRIRRNYSSFLPASAASMALFRAARPAMSPRVVFSTAALIFLTVDFVASAAARFSAFSAATASLRTSS